MFVNVCGGHVSSLYATQPGEARIAAEAGAGGAPRPPSTTRRPSAARARTTKERPDAGTLEIPLVHNGVVAFSVAANRRPRHRILADPAGGAGDNEWLGLTFRTSKTV